MAADLQKQDDGSTQSPISTQAIIQRAYDVFSELARAQHSHELDAEALATSLQEFHKLHITQESAQRLLDIADLDGDHKLNFSEFYSVYGCLMLLADHFECEDLRRLRLTDVRRALNRVGLSADDEQVRAMFQFGDSHSIGKDLTELHEIDLEHFLKIYLRHPVNKSQAFLLSWWSAGKNSVPYFKPIEVTPSQDFVAGTFAGMALTLVGHPFDTVKVRLQTNHAYRGVMHCISETITKENILAFYKGMGGPMTTIPLINAIVFGAYAQAKDFIHKFRAPRRHLDLGEITVAGAYAGAVSCLVCCPVELIKTRLQIQHEFDPTQQFKGPLDAVRKIVRQNGIKGLYRGMSATIYREVPGYGGQFFLYEYLKRLFTKDGEQVENLGAAPLIMAGGTAGIFGWILSYPMDYVKSQIQAEPFDKKTPYPKNKWLLDGGFFSCWRQTVAKHGHRELWRGFLPCIARAFPANGAGFLAYELALKFMRRLDFE